MSDDIVYDDEPCRVTIEPYDTDVLASIGSTVTKFAPLLHGKDVDFQALSISSTGIGSANWKTNGVDQNGVILTLKITLGAPLNDEDYQIMTGETIKKQAESMAMRFMAAMGGDDGLH